jgi:group II intron reverse transcriptase/maturase
MLPEQPTIRRVLERQNLELAWQQVRANRGAPGVDEMTIARWERNWQENLDRLSHLVRTNTYRPNRPRRFRILKPDGGWRELSILTVSDRVLQRAALNVLAPAFEKLFLDGSYGYRLERGVAQAVDRVLRARDHGFLWVFDADIDSCFDSLDHTLVLGEMRQVVSNVTLLRLIELWLDAGRSPTRYRKSDGERRQKGVPLGAVISPLLCNVALHGLDAELERTGWPWARYADDFVVLSRTHSEALEAWRLVEAALADLRLRLEPAKTWVRSFEQGFKFLGVTFKGDSYEFVHSGKRFVVRGRNISVLSQHPPEGYGWEW